MEKSAEIPQLPPCLRGSYSTGIMFQSTFRHLPLPTRELPVFRLGKLRSFVNVALFDHATARHEDGWLGLSAKNGEYPNPLQVGLLC